MYASTHQGFISNWGGRLGAQVAAVLLFFLGSASLILVPFLLVLASTVYKKNRVTVIIGSFVVLIVTVATLCHAYSYEWYRGILFPVGLWERHSIVCWPDMSEPPYIHCACVGFISSYYGLPMGDTSTCQVAERCCSACVQQPAGYECMRLHCR